MDIDFNKERRWWDAKAANEDKERRDEWVNKAIRWKELENILDQDIESILAIGGGTGAFSIPLAKRGYNVTHLDISREMLAIARKKAKNVDNISFIEGNSVDLKECSDRSYDLVLNMDGAISFCGSMYKKAISETCRVARKFIFISVSHRALMTASWLEASIQVMGNVIDAIYEMFEKGEWHQEQFKDNNTLAKDCTQGYFGAFKAFLPEELKNLLKDEGIEIIKCRGIGTLAYFLSNDILNEINQDKSLREKFLELCDLYDERILPNGFGTRNRAGLLAIGRIKSV